MSKRISGVSVSSFFAFAATQRAFVSYMGQEALVRFEDSSSDIPRCTLGAAWRIPAGMAYADRWFQAGISGYMNAIERRRSCGAIRYGPALGLVGQVET